jgi:hypothetical protein
MRTVYDEDDVRRTIGTLVDRIAAAFSADSLLNIVGIRTRGEILARRLAEQLAGRGFDKIGRGVLDITLYRDDLSEIGPRPLVRPTEMHLAMNGHPLLLVDDVLFTARFPRPQAQGCSLESSGECEAQGDRRPRRDSGRAARISDGSAAAKPLDPQASPVIGSFVRG